MAVSTVKELCEKIWDIEEKYDLFNREIEGVYFWKLIRMPLYYEITKKIEIYDQAHTQPNQSFIDKLLYLPKALLNTHLNGTLKRDDHKDYLIFEHSRKVKVNGEYIDKYTYYLTDNLEDNSYEIIDKPYLRKHYNKPSANRSYVENTSFAFNYIFNKFKNSKLFLDEKHKILIKKIESELKKSLNIEISLIDMILTRINKFKAKFSFYNKLLKKRKPKKVFLVVSYSKEPIIAACKNNDIKVIEIQHGTMSKYHLGYSYPNNEKICYFPDKLYMFGQYWSDSTPIPLESNKINNYGFPYLEKRLHDYKDSNKKNNQVLFISQGVIGKKLSKIAYQFAKKNNNYKIIFKLHPGEYDRWKIDYNFLLKGNKLFNFEVIDHNNINLYQLFAESEYQVGVFSTAIYEGLTLNCKTVLANLPGVEYMEYLIKKNIVRFAENADELSKIINEDDFEQNYDKDYFFSGI